MRSSEARVKEASSDVAGRNRRGTAFRGAGGNVSGVPACCLTRSARKCVKRGSRSKTVLAQVLDAIQTANRSYGREVLLIDRTPGVARWPIERHHGEAFFFGDRPKDGYFV